MWHWFTLGPYHFARMNAIAAQSGVELIVVESASVDDHGWNRAGCQPRFELITLNDSRLRGVDKRRCGRELEAILERARPDVIVSCGYSERHSWLAAKRRRRAQKAVWVVWSESARRDHRRLPVVELAKRFIVARADGGLVAGGPQAEYLHSLGMARERICEVGGCVDNSYFRLESARTARMPGEANYFLYVGRFIAAKNLAFLLRAYGQYRGAMDRAGVEPWNLTLVGSGREEAALKRLVLEERIDGVAFPGPKQIEEIVHYYGAARALVLPSYSEPWGLVVNEAMACGLPALVSEACGCAADLVAPGLTGYVFDPAELDTCVEALSRMTLEPLECAASKAEIHRRVERFNPGNFATKAVEHFERLRDRRPEEN